MIQQLKKLLSTRWLSVISLAIAILTKIGLLRVFLNVGNDKAALLLTTKNFLAGHGIAVGRTYMSDLSLKTYVPYIGWPPGYDLILSPFLTLFPDNFMLATFCVDVVATLIFFIYLRKLLLQLGFSTWLCNLFLLFQGFFLNDFIISSHPTDWLAMSFIVAGWYHCNFIFHKKFLTSHAIYCFLFFGAATLIRYQYMPVCVAGLAGLLFAALKEKDRRQLIHTVTIAGSLILLTTAVLLYQKVSSGAYMYQTPGMTAGFHPGNLSALHPFALQSFIETEVLSTQLSLLSPLSFGEASHWIQIFSFVLLFLLLLIAASWFKNKYSQRVTTADYYWITGFLLSAAVTAILVWLSVTHSRQSGENNWTFVMDGRYFAFVILYIQLFVWKKLFDQHFSKRGLKVLRTITATVFLFSAVHGGFVLTKKLAQPILSFKDILPSQPEMRTMLSFIKEQREKNPGRIICISGYPQVGYFADWYGANALFYDELRLTDSFKTSKPAILLLTFTRRLAPTFESIIRQPGFSLYKQEGDWFYYMRAFEPVNDK